MIMRVMVSLQATLRMLCNCIKSNSGGADPASADEIEKEYSASPANSRHRSSSPVDASLSKDIVKHVMSS